VLSPIPEEEEEERKRKPALRGLAFSIICSADERARFRSASIRISRIRTSGATSSCDSFVMTDNRPIFPKKSLSLLRARQDPPRTHSTLSSFPSREFISSGKSTSGYRSIASSDLLVIKIHEERAAGRMNPITTPDYDQANPRGIASRSALGGRNTSIDRRGAICPCSECRARTH